MVAVSRPRLLVPGLVPRDPARETYRGRPGGTTAVSLRPDDRLTIRDLHGGQRAVVVGLARADGILELFGPASPPGAEETFRAETETVVQVSAPAGRPVVEGGVPASDLQLE